jgi:RNA-directed DNA polymerase
MAANNPMAVASSASAMPGATTARLVVCALEIPIKLFMIPHTVPNNPTNGAASPLLANIYMNRFLKHWRQTGSGEAFRAHVVSYADDFVILSRGRAAEALDWTKAVMSKLELTLNETKTSLRDARQERFTFLGYSFGPHWYKANGKWYLGASPSKKSVQRLKTTVGSLLVPGNIAPWQEVRDKLNRFLRGWSNYFCYGTRR